MTETLRLVYDYNDKVVCMTTTVSAKVPQGWQNNHPLAGFAQFEWIPGLWVGGHGNLNDPCRWQSGYWRVTPIYSRTQGRAIWGLKADPSGSVFAPGEGRLQTMASDLVQTTDE